VEGTQAQIQRFCDNGDLFALTEGRQMTSSTSVGMAER